MINNNMKLNTEEKRSTILTVNLIYSLYCFVAWSRCSFK
jgi:hypothetical protein